MDEKRYFQSYDGITLMYRRWLPLQKNQNIPLVLLHGAASNSTRWWYFIEHSRLTTDRILLRPDLRGNGESMWRGPACIEHWLQDIAAMLRHEQQPRAIVLGHCLGANIAVNFASHYPEMCAGLILVEPMAAKAVTGILARLKPLMPLFRLLIKLLKFLNRLGLYRRRLKSVDLKKLDHPVHQASPKEQKQALANHSSPWCDFKTTPVAQYISNFIALLRPLPVSEIHCAGLIIQASGKSMTDAAKTEILFGKLPRMTLVEIESEHWIPATHPDRLCELVDEWILSHQEFSDTAPTRRDCFSATKTD